MARPSTIHALGDRLRDFDAALLRGETGPALAKRFGLSLDAVKRYRIGEFKQRVRQQTLTQAQITKASQVPNLNELNAAEELARLYQQGQSLLEEARNNSQLGAAVSALGKLTKVLEVHFKLLGDIPTGSTTIEVTINQVSNEVKNIAMNFDSAPPEVRQWAAKNMLSAGQST
jgi:hypothetical protein